MKNTFITRNRKRDKLHLLSSNKLVIISLIGIAGFLERILNLVFNYNNEKELIVLFLQLCALFLGLWFLQIVSKEETIKVAKDEFKDYLENTNNIKEIVENILAQDQNASSLTDDKFKELVNKWYKISPERSRMKYSFVYKKYAQSFIDDLGLEYFCYTLLTKAQNAKIINISKLG